jgi:hypothetical protein
MNFYIVIQTDWEKEFMIYKNLPKKEIKSSFIYDKSKIENSCYFRVVLHSPRQYFFYQ